MEKNLNVLTWDRLLHNLSRKLQSNDNLDLTIIQVKFRCYEPDARGRFHLKSLRGQIVMCRMWLLEVVIFEPTTSVEVLTLEARMKYSVTKDSLGSPAVWERNSFLEYYRGGHN